MSDGCCDGCATTESGGERRGEHPSIWRVREIQAAGIAGVSLGAALIAGRAGAEAAALVLSVLALVVGGATFIPQSLRGLLDRKSVV